MRKKKIQKVECLNCHKKHSVEVRILEEIKDDRFIGGNCKVSLCPKCKKESYIYIEEN